MKKPCFALVSLLLMILHSPLARAEESLPAPILFVTQFLQLSEEQTGALITMIRTRDAALQPIATKVQASRQALGKLLEGPSADAPTAGRLLLEIRAGEMEANAVARDAAASFEAILTTDQRNRLQFLRQAAQIEPAIPAFKAVGLL